MESNEVTTSPKVSQTPKSKKVLLYLGVFLLLLIVGFYLKLYLPNVNNFLVEEGQVVSTKSNHGTILLEDISKDPRFSNENFIKPVAIELEPSCFSPNMTLESCPRSPFTKEITPGVSAVFNIHPDEKGGKGLFLQFNTPEGIIKTIPEIPAGDISGIAFLDKSFILVSFSCDECGTWYSLFDGSSWKRESAWGIDIGATFIDKNFPPKKLFFNQKNPPFDINISNDFIKIDETVYCCDSVFSDTLNDTRLDTVGYYSFLLDRKTSKLVALGSRHRDSFNTNLSSPENEKNTQVMREYLNWLVNTDNIDFKQEIFSWPNFIDFGGTKIPYPKDWTAEVFYSKDNETGVKFFPSNFKITGRYISMVSQRMDYNGIIFDESKGIDFELLKVMDTLQSSLKDYVQEVSRKDVKITEWQKNFSQLFSFKTDFTFDVPVNGDERWPYIMAYCNVQCVLISPWREDSFLNNMNSIDNRYTGSQPFGVIIREIPSNLLSVSTIDQKPVFVDSTRDFLNDFYTKNNLSPNEAFQKIGKPYAVTTDINNTDRYYFKINDQYYLCFTFAGIQLVDKNFIKEFLDRIEIRK